MIRIKLLLQLTPNHPFFSATFAIFAITTIMNLNVIPGWNQWEFFLVILHILKNICANFQLVIIFGWVTVVYPIQQPDYAPYITSEGCEWHSLLSSINFKVTECHNIIQITSLKLLEFSGLSVWNVLCWFLLLSPYYLLTNIIKVLVLRSWYNIFILITFLTTN